MFADRRRRQMSELAGQGGARSRNGRRPVQRRRGRAGGPPGTPTGCRLPGQVEHEVVVIVLLSRRGVWGGWRGASGRSQGKNLRIDPSPESQQGAADRRQTATAGR